MINRDNIQELQLITNKIKLIKFLQKENNSYSDFILERLQRDPLSLVDKQTQSHHIIPSYLNISDEPWNKITLTIEEHSEAHKLLYETSKFEGDLSAYYLIRGQVELGMKIIRKMAHETMRERKSGFFDRKLQAELASRPKKPRKAYARDPKIIKIFIAGFELQNEKGDIIKFAPYECDSIRHVVEKVLEHKDMVDLREAWNTCDNQNSFYLYTGFNKILSSSNEMAKKPLKSCKGWKVFKIYEID